VTALSKNAMELLTVASGSPKGPKQLWDAWQAGDLTVPDLHVLIPQVWAYTDWPECAIGAIHWTVLFRTTGFIAVPTTLPAPTAPLTLFRGASEKRSLGMAWSQVAAKAGQFQERYNKLGQEAHLYTATVQPKDVLAVFGLRGEYEVIVDPQSLTEVERSA
jgi:hypothetical protein